jgi:hypothetical protein
MPPRSGGYGIPGRLSHLGCNFAQGRCVRTGGGSEAGRLSKGQHPRAVKTGASTPYQDREIRAWARRNGHRIVGMFSEQGRSGALDLEDRAALTAAIDLIATGKAEGLVYYSLTGAPERSPSKRPSWPRCGRRPAGGCSPPTTVKSSAMTTTTRCGPRCGRWPGPCTN